MTQLLFPDYFAREAAFADEVNELGEIHDLQRVTAFRLIYKGSLERPAGRCSFRGLLCLVAAG